MTRRHTIFTKHKSFGVQRQSWQNTTPFGADRFDLVATDGLPSFGWPCWCNLARFVGGGGGMSAPRDEDAVDRRDDADIANHEILSYLNLRRFDLGSWKHVQKHITMGKSTFHITS